MLIFRSFKVIALLIIASVADAIYLNCVYTANNNELTVANAYKCEATILSIGDYRTVSGVSQNHLAGRNNLMVQVVSIQNQPMRLFPLDLHTFFPNLEIIRIQNAELGMISTNELKEFPRLKELHFNQNLIQTIDRSVFAANQGLQVIKLSNNPLRHVADHVFESLPQLRWLEIINSTCITLNVVNNRDEILINSFNVFRHCPPSSQMVSEVILESPELQLQIETLIAEKVVEYLAANVDDVLVDHNDRLDVVENNIIPDLEARIVDLENPLLVHHLGP